MSEENVETKSSKLKVHIPEHCVLYKEVIRGAIKEAVDAFSDDDRKEGMRKAIEEFILGEIAIKDAATESKVSRWTLQKYSEKIEVLITDLLGLRAIDPKVEAVITPGITYEELKEIVSQNGEAQENEESTKEPSALAIGSQDHPKEKVRPARRSTVYALRSVMVPTASLEYDPHSPVEKKQQPQIKRLSNQTIASSPTLFTKSEIAEEVPAKKTKQVDGSPIVPQLDRRVTFAAEIIQQASPEGTRKNNVLKGILKTRNTEINAAQNDGIINGHAKGLFQLPSKKEKRAVDVDLSNRLERIEKAIHSLGNMLNDTKALIERNLVKGQKDVVIETNVALDKVGLDTISLPDDACELNAENLFTLIACDCVLIVAGRRILVNKGLLSAYSNFFDDLFRANIDPFAIEDVDYEDFVQLLKHIHPVLEKENISETNVECLLKLSTRFQVTPVVKQCEAFLESCSVDKISLCQKLVIAQTFGLEEVQRNSIEKCGSIEEMKALQEDDKYSNLDHKIFKSIFENLTKKR